LALLGAGVVITANFQSPAVALSPVNGVSEAKQYVIGNADDVRKYVEDRVDPAHNDTWATSWHQQGTHPGDPAPVLPVVLVGDSLTWYEAVGFGEGGGTQIFSPNAESWALSPYTSSSPDVSTRFVIQPEPDAGKTCAQGDPISSAGVLANAWCRGALVYTVSLADARAGDDQMRWAAAPYDWKAVLVGRSQHEVYMSGPVDAHPGRGNSTSESVTVLDPKLNLVKKVCVNTVEDQCLLTDPKVWVDSTEIPANSSHAFFRVDVKNTGNVELVNVHMALDTLEATAADVAKTGTATVDGKPANQALLAASLDVGQTASKIVVVPLDGTLDGVLKNTATANAELPETVRHPGATDGVPTVDPEGNPLSQRFTGNPTPGYYTGEPGMVPSNEDSAEVFERVAAIALEKWVCGETDNDCDEPVGLDLAALGAGTPAGGWVKSTVVPMASEALWLLVVTNPGETVLVNVTLNREDLLAGSDDHGDTTMECAVGRDLGRLDPGGSIAVMCTTDQITSTAEQTVINTARVCGAPADDNGNLLPGPDRVGNQPEVCSDESYAEVTTDEPKPAPDPTTTPTPTTPTTPAPAPKPKPLSVTGANVAVTVVLGMILLAGGIGLVAVRMRARQAQ